MSRRRRRGKEALANAAARAHPATLTPKRDLRLQVSVAAIALIAIIMSLTAWPSSAPARPLPGGVARSHSGLLMADPLDKVVTLGQLQDQYAVDGSAGPRLGWVSETTSGLAVGIKAHSGWAGWFASTVHAAGPAVAWHAVVSPTALRPGTKGRGIAVFAVQTATTQKSGAINYIVVAAVCRSGSYRWLVGYAHGLVAGASTKVLWTSKWQPISQPISERGGLLPSQAVTVVTDGSHSLSVWFGTREIFTSESLVLKMPAPFQAYLEVQSSSPAYDAIFNDFWVADDAPLVIDGLPDDARAQLSSSPGPSAVGASAAGAIAQGSAGSAGVATLRLPVPELVGSGTISVIAAGHATVVQHVPYAGGDLLRWAASN